MTRESTSQDAIRVVGHRLQKVDEPARSAATASHGSGNSSGLTNSSVNGSNTPGPDGPSGQASVRPAARAPRPAAAQTPDRASVLRQVVLVDREIDGLRDVAIALRDEFDFHITISGAEALNLLRDGAIDTIVVGQTLYSSTGLNVLAEARRHAPHTHRVLLANAVEAGSIERGTAAVAPFKVLQRPCTAEKLRELLKTNASPDEEPLTLQDSPPSRPTRPPMHTHDPADFEHVVMETPEPQARKSKSSKGAATGAESLPIIVYTDNAEFYQAITSALQDRHEIRLCTQLDRAAELAEMGLCPLLITDRAGTQVELQRISIALRSLDAGMISIASGTPEVGAALRKLLGTGALHSFLPKPINAPLVRLAVESAKRQYLQARALKHEPDLNPAPAAVPVRAKPKPAATSIYVPGFQPDFTVDDFEDSAWRRAAPRIAVAVALIAGVLTGGWYWWEHRTPVVDNAGTVTRDLDLAQRAFDAGRYSSPTEDSAIYYYNQALTAAPNDPAATLGLERTLEKIIEQGERALMEERLDAAAESIATVRALQPSNRRLPFLESQLDKERRRLANRRDARETVAAAPQNADTAASLTSVSQPITNSSQRQQLITRWLSTARQRLAQDRLLQPENDNAEFYLRQVERLDPENAAMQQGLREIGSRLLANARQALARQQLDVAKQRATDALRFGVDSTVIEKLRMDINAMANESARSNYLRLALQRTRDNRLLEPDRDSAKYYLGQLQRLDPTATETEQALRALALKLIENADMALAQRQTNSATQILNEARRLGFSGEELNDADARIRAVRMPASALPAKSSTVSPPKAIKTVPPKFPEEAMRAGAEGWVDVRFRIAADGSVTDVTPIGSNTVNQFTVQFERAAVAAIRQYKFEAREISETQTQSMTVRVQFKAQ